ncbi:MAG: 2-amino-3,7-dideoxy-D-threo-hept-6-ulosonate synthase [Desulfomicrobium sp.]|nr:2-amino-3,7-dideoxy-D-threo-hept-6-ulosonate synthase [Desulfomicrobium sp.]MDP3430230.1 2-amino-3,7-dideoxy-D-threo-hept-6-ulosonate synthase [Desulfomicrobium sp.]
MNMGKSVRLERIFNRNTGRSIIVPLDHGTTVGPIQGLVDLRSTVNKVAEGGANAVLMHKGLPRCSHRGHGRDVGLIIHLSASTTLSPFPNAKILVGTVEDGIKLGADAVSVHLNLGDESERDMLRDMGQVASKCAEWGMPLLAMVYARGPKIKSEWDPATVAHCARLAEELGADVIKVVYTGDPESFSRVTEGCCIPIVIAGGPRMESPRDIIQMAHDSVAAGGAGLSMGRNIFQSEDPTRLVQALHAVVHMDYSVEQALALLEEPKL